MLTPEEVGPCTVLLEGIVGEGVEIDAADARTTSARARSPSISPSTCSTRASATRTRSRPLHLFGQIQRIARRWIDEGYLVAKGGTDPAMVTYLEMADQAAERIYLACQRHEHGEKRIKAILDPYNPRARPATSASPPPRDTLDDRAAASATSTTWSATATGRPSSRACSKATPRCVPMGDILWIDPSRDKAANPHTY